MHTVYIPWLGSAGLVTNELDRGTDDVQERDIRIRVAPFTRILEAMHEVRFNNQDAT